MEDFVTWVDSSKIKQHVMNYNDEVSSSESACEHFFIFSVAEGKNLQLYVLKQHT